MLDATHPPAQPMGITYPIGPKSVPADLTVPPATYRRRVWLALGGLLLFAVLYAGLTGWLGWTAYRLLSSAVEGGEDSGAGFIVGGCAALLTVFMVKGFFFIKHGRAGAQEIEVTAADQPHLFEFLLRVADEAKAPRPHRVFLSPRVNASVSYDLSLINFIIPSKKNLEIGLGLVNVLTLGELKAVLAHEFGHFSQRSMAVGRWVYIAQQIAGQIVARRDKFDHFLNQWNRIDIRIAWVGWLLSIIVWSIRSLVDSFFSIALRMQRALSREMEMHADLVAVSLTGSDSPIYALHRLRTADDALDRALVFANGELAKGHVVRDLFAVQSRVIEQMSRLVDADAYRSAPPLPAAKPETLRLFKAELAQPPRMWSTHPPNDEREVNAKRVYIPAPLDDRSGWLLFTDPQALREKISALVLGEHEKATPLATDAALRELDRQFGRESLDPRYRGIYLDRSIVRPAKRPPDLYEPTAAGADIASLYPETLARDIERLDTITREKALLEAVANGFMEAPGGVVRHRDRQLRPRDLPQVIAQLDQEIAAVEQSLWAHDRRCRTAHRAIAATVGQGWEEYLCGLAAVLHYADHNERNITDARAALANHVAIATAGGRVRKSDIAFVVAAAGALHDGLEAVFRKKALVLLDTTLLEQLGVESWAAMLEELKLGAPSQQNIGKWLGVVDGWANSALGPLGMLRRAALDQLLKTEAQLAQWTNEGAEPPPAAAASRVPDGYPVLLPGKERKRQRKLDWWKRFQAADGFLPATARFLAAAAIVGALLAFGGKVGEATVTIYNGLGRPITVVSESKTVPVDAFATASMTLPPGVHALRASTADGRLIETVQGTVQRGFGNYVYNVAGAGSLVEWTQIYGSRREPKPPRALGAPLWTETRATTLFTNPPRSISSSTGGGTVTVLSGYSGESPTRVLNALDNDRGIPGVIAAHARWDPANARYTMSWLEAAKTLPNVRQIIAARLSENPSEVLALRVEQDIAVGAARDSVCAKTRAAADASPNEIDRQYLAIRCLPDEDERNRLFIAKSDESPKNAWLAYAAGYSLAQEQRWPDALAHLERARASDSSLASIVAEDVARLRRMTQGLHAGLVDIKDLSDELRLHVALETGDEFENSPYLAYADLARGHVDDAWRRAVNAREVRRQLLPLIAASDGADPALADSALAAVPDSSLGQSSALILTALAIRQKHEPSRYADIAKRSGAQGSDRLIEFGLMLGAGAKPDAAERELGQISPAARGMAYSMGAVILGRRAPREWRVAAMRLLFASERPYFQ